MEIIRNKVSFNLSYYHLLEPWSTRKDSMEFSFGRLVFEESTRIFHVSDFYKFKVLEFQYFNISCSNLQFCHLNFLSIHCAIFYDQLLSYVLMKFYKIPYFLSRKCLCGRRFM